MDSNTFVSWVRNRGGMVAGYSRSELKEICIRNIMQNEDGQLARVFVRLVSSSLAKNDASRLAEHLGRLSQASYTLHSIKDSLAPLDTVTWGASQAVASMHFMEAFGEMMEHEVANYVESNIEVWIKDAIGYQQDMEARA